MSEPTISIWDVLKTGNLEVVKICIENNPSVLRQKHRGKFPFHVAVESGNLEVVKYFVEVHGADVNTKTKYGETTLHFAARSGNLEVVKYFVEVHGADVNTIKKYGETSLHFAATVSSQVF
ncbi:hypothetical protein FACS189427_12690 [Planctomycetales bacterium]|nr:hypothetical protein FACS189427_12690 [Planctomycetales bacterium]